MIIDQPNPRLIAHCMGDRLKWNDADIFCGSRCGFKCKRVAYDRAVREADLLIRQLGPEWRGEVWENWGWNFCAILPSKKGGRLNAHCRVTAHTDGSHHAGNYLITGYSAELKIDGPPSQIFSDHDPNPGHPCSIPPLHRFDAPRKAVANAVANARVVAENVREAAQAALASCPALPK